jgi:3-hydroxyisobutyrate dehydrogenase-like beta-hydroxyacid dehydrogenase
MWSLLCKYRRSSGASSGQIGDGAFEPRLKAKLGLKDLRLATEAGSATGRSLPMLERDGSIMADVTVRGGDPSLPPAIAPALRANLLRHTPSQPIVGGQQS